MAAGRKKGAAADAAPEGDAAPTVNRFGELGLVLGGVRYGLRPSFGAIEAIEEKVRPLDSLARDMHEGQVSVAEMGIVTAELMRAYGEAHPKDPLILDYTGANPRKLAELIYERGASSVRVALFVIITMALTGGFDAKGEARPATGTKEETPDAGSSD